MPPEKPWSRSYCLRAAGFGVVYFLSAELSRYLSVPHTWFVPFWLPSGCFAAMLLLNPTAAWPAIVIGATIGSTAFDHLAGTPLRLSSISDLADAAEAVTGALLFRRWVSRTPTFATLREFFGLVGCSAVLGPVVGATIGAFALWASGAATSYFADWRDWWIGAAMAVLVLTPLLVSWFSGGPPGWRGPRRRLETAVAMAGLTFTAWFVLVRGNGIQSGDVALLLPFVLWAALRFGIRGASATVLVLGVVMTFFTTHYLVGLSPAQIAAGAYLTTLHVFLVVSALVGLVPAYAVAELGQMAHRIQASEERFRTLTSAAFEGTLITENGRVVDISDQGLAMLGYTREEIMGLEAVNLVSPEFRPVVADNIRFDRETSYELEFQRKDGTRFPGEVRPKTARVGHRVLRMTAIRDLTERRQHEERQTMMEEQMRQMQKMEALGTLAGGIAHDFNNILTGILGNIQIAEMDLEGGHAAAGALASAQKAARRARDLVARILSFSWPREDQRTRAPLGPTVLEAVELLRAGLPSTIEIRTEIAPACPNVEFDSGQIHQVIMNLGTNSAQAMTSRGGTIRISLRSSVPGRALMDRHPQVTPAHTVCLTIRDDGCGMPPEVQQRIFEPFYTTKPFGKGTGLGLSLVHSVMKSHHGAIVVESDRDRGTTFDLYFPTATAESAGAARSPGEAGSSALEPFGLGRSILLVDDEDGVRAVATHMLERLGFNPAPYSRAAPALEAFRASPDRFAAVITDITMPGMTGLELARGLAGLCDH